MTVQAVVSESRDPVSPKRPDPRRLLGRALFIGIAPVVAHGVIRPFVASDTLGLAVGGAIPMIYGVVLVVSRRRVDALALLASIGYALGCLLSLLLGGNSLPLELHEAFITFTVGVVLVVAVAARRPVPLARVFRLPSRQLDASLGVMVGGFLILHALLHVVLAVTLSTSSYLVMGRVVDWTTIAGGLLGLSAYVRRSAPAGSAPDRAP